MIDAILTVLLFIPLLFALGFAMLSIVFGWKADYAISYRYSKKLDQLLNVSEFTKANDFYWSRIGKRWTTLFYRVAGVALALIAIGFMALIAGLISC